MKVRNISTKEKKIEKGDFLVSKTDTKGLITYGNEIFIEISGYDEEELLGKPHNIIRHFDMPKIVFKLLWKTVSAKKEIFAYVKNLAKDGSYYWVFANVTPDLSLEGEIKGYYSVRRKPTERGVESISQIYEQLLRAEKSGGIDESERILNEFLTKQGKSYDEIIMSLQK